MATTASLVTTNVIEVDYENSVKPIEFNMAVQIEDPIIEQAPGILVVSVTEALALTKVDFYIDTTLVYSANSDSQGELEAISLAISRSIGTAGTHTLTVRQTGAVTASATFQILEPPPVEPTAYSPDADPIQVPGTLTENGTRRWVWQDLYPTSKGGLGSWIMPLNPQEMTSPFTQLNITGRHTVSGAARTALTTHLNRPTDEGQFHVFEGSLVPQDWTFKGYCPTKEMRDMMMTYRNLNRRLYIIDHRNRAWKVAIIDCAFTSKLRQNFNNDQTDWGADYEVTCVILDQTYRTPQ